jgi:hypothetical protein
MTTNAIRRHEIDADRAHRIAAAVFTSADAAADIASAAGTLGAERVRAAAESLALAAFAAGDDANALASVHESRALALVAGCDGCDEHASDADVAAARLAYGAAMDAYRAERAAFAAE